MTDSPSILTDMQHRTADENERRALVLMQEDDGLGELQAYRVAQMQRAMRGMNKKCR